MKEKKNNPRLAVNIMQEIKKEIMHQECLIPTLSSCFNRLANSVNFAAKFCVFVYKYKRDSLTNFRAQKARENLKREKGAEENRRVFEKTEGCLKKQKGGKGKRYGAILFRNVIDHHLVLITVRENSFSYSFIVI